MGALGVCEFGALTLALSLRERGLPPRRALWIPAFAGMTVGLGEGIFVGFSWSGVGFWPRCLLGRRLG